MHREQIWTRLAEILTSGEFEKLHVDVSRLAEDTSLLNDVGLDSLQLLDLVVAMENAFSFRVNSSSLNIDMFDRFGDVVDFVERSVRSAAAEAGAPHGESREERHSAERIA